MAEVERIQMLRAMAERKNKPLHWYGLAMALRAEGELHEALEVFERIHELDREYVPAWFMRAQVLEELQDVAASTKALECGISLAESQGNDHAAAEMRSMLDSLQGA